LRRLWIGGRAKINKKYQEDLMNHKWFDEILEDRISKIRKVLSKKAGEYSSGDDRLHNFKRAAALNCETPEKALAGMLTKHIVSIYDMIDDLDSMSCPDYAVWDEKLGDAINYCILLEALISERIHNNFDMSITD
jgi:hypothetical protein